jgi:hypothetical protein
VAALDPSPRSLTPDTRHPRGPHLVCAPASLLDNWAREIGHWCPKLRVLTYHGNSRSAAQGGGNWPSRFEMLARQMNAVLAGCYLPCSWAPVSAAHVHHPLMASHSSLLCALLSPRPRARPGEQGGDPRAPGGVAHEGGRHADSGCRR